MSTSFKETRSSLKKNIKTLKTSKSSGSERSLVGKLLLRKTLTGKNIDKHPSKGVSEVLRYFCFVFCFQGCLIELLRQLQNISLRPGNMNIVK